jgi:hypothetical protein
MNGKVSWVGFEALAEAGLDGVWPNLKLLRFAQPSEVVGIESYDEWVSLDEVQREESCRQVVRAVWPDLRVEFGRGEGDDESDSEIGV